MAGAAVAVHGAVTGPRRFLPELMRTGGTRDGVVGWNHFQKQCIEFLIPVPS